MVNRKIAMSALSIVAAMALMGGATFAFFTSQATSNDNVFTSGVMNLTIGDDNDPLTSGLSAVTGSIHSPANWAPGQEFVSYSCFRNSGTVDIEEIILSLNSSGSNQAFRDAIIAKKVELGKVDITDCNDSVSATLTDFTNFFIDRFDDADSVDADDDLVRLSGLLADVNGTDRVEDDLLNGAAPANLLPGEIVKFRVTWLFDSEAGDTTQDQNLDLDIQYTARQDEVAS